MLTLSKRKLEWFVLDRTDSLTKKKYSMKKGILPRDKEVNFPRMHNSYSTKYTRENA